MSVPELLAPAGSLDAVRAALGSGADAVYLGATRFNARDEGAQLSLEELEQACRMAHARGRRIYLTLNVLIKPAELVEALDFLGEAIDRGIDAVIVQDLGLIRLIRAIYPNLEVHGSTQTTVHDEAGARVLRDLGVSRVVLARENTLEDIRAIRGAVPDLGLESFVHGALCISYSGQCFMSGMISERSANRGACAQSCRKDYVLTDLDTREELDRGFLISARDLGAYQHLREIAEAGIVCLKVEGRKKRAEYVATVTRTYRLFLDRLSSGISRAPTEEEVQPLVQIYSRGFTPGMYGGRAGRDYVTRTQPDNRGVLLGRVVDRQAGELIVEVSEPISVGDGLGFESPSGSGGPTKGFAVTSVRPLRSQRGLRLALRTTERVPPGWRVIRTSRAALLREARDTMSAVERPQSRRIRLDIRVFGSSGAPLKAQFTANGQVVTVLSDSALRPADRRPTDAQLLREQFGRLGESPFVIGDIDTAGLAAGLFLPVSELNRLRQSAVDELKSRLATVLDDARATRQHLIVSAVDDVLIAAPRSAASTTRLIAQAYDIDAARDAAKAGAHEIVFDPFLRHPVPSRTRVLALRDELAGAGASFRLRTPTIIRPSERGLVQKWLDLNTPILSGHVGLVHELAEQGRDVVADYAANVFNAHSAAELFGCGASGLVASIELTAQEIGELVSPWHGAGFQVVAYGRPEGMTIEHCVLSAAFAREPTTCRDLCVQKHRNVELTDPTGYRFPVATDLACRNRLLHSRPLDASEFLPTLWRHGIRAFHLLFNVPGIDVAGTVRVYRDLMDGLEAGGVFDPEPARRMIGTAYTRGHFARAV